MKLAGVIIIIVSILYLIIFSLQSNFINLKENMKNYYKVFNGFKNSFAFLVFPFILGTGISLVCQHDEEVLSQFIVFVSIVISVLFSTSSIIVSKTYEQFDEKTKDKIKIIINQTQSIIFFVVYISILSLIFLILNIALMNYLTEYIVLLVIINVINNSLLIMIALNILVILKRLCILIVVK